MAGSTFQVMAACKAEPTAIQVWQTCFKCAEWLCRQTITDIDLTLEYRR
jgi:hypothetical protein